MKKVRHPPTCLLISASPHLFTNLGLAQAFEARGFRVQCEHPKKIATGSLKRITKDTHPLVLMRAGLSYLRSTLEAARRLSEKGLHVVNVAEGIAAAKDKWLTHLAWAQEGLPQVPTIKVDSRDALKLAWGFLPPPWVLKALYGSQGKGVHLASTLPQALRQTQGYFERGFSAIVQPKLPVKRDLRLLVVGGKVLAAVRRHPAKGEFRSNWHRGGRLELIQPSAREKSLAIRAAACLKLEFAGIDMLETRDGRLHLLEANDSPGLQGLSGVFRGDVFGEVAQQLSGLV